MQRKICFVALYSLPLLTSSNNLKYIGGSELIQVIIGKELAKRGFQISFMTYNENSEKKKIDEFTIIKTYSPSQNYSLIKNTLLFWKSLKKANSDIYIQGSGFAGIIPFFCITHGKKYIKWIVSDSDLLFERFHTAHPIITKIKIFIEIKFAHTIIVQNLFQKELIEKKFKRKSILIKNPVNIPDNNEITENEIKKNILWVGTIRPVKQPDIFLKIAKSLPQFHFIMIGGESNEKDEKQLFYEIKKEAKTIKNLEFLGFIPDKLIQKSYKEAAILINTSQIEGFPNSFLEAWMNYTPIISLNVDPDEVICNKKLGLHSKTFNQIILDVNMLYSNDNLRKDMGMNARQYVEQNHDSKQIAKQFEKLILSFEKLTKKK